MRDLESLIKRTKSMISYGLTQKQIRGELERSGWHPELIRWALRGAKDELNYQEDTGNA